MKRSLMTLSSAERRRPTTFTTESALFPCRMIFATSSDKPSPA